MNKSCTVQLVAIVLLVVAATCVFGQSCSTTSRYHNGTCNNLANPLLGSTGRHHIRTAEGYEYADGISQMPANRPNERTVTVNIMGYKGGLVNEKDLSIFATFFAQFVSHDLSLVERPTDNRTFIDILDPNDDFLFLAPGVPKTLLHLGPGKRIEVRRSLGEIFNGKFETFNRVPAYLDLNPVYGSDDLTASKLRSFVNGKLHMHDYNIDISKFYGQAPGTTVVHVEDVLPTVAMTGLPKDIANLVEPDDEVFSAGDPRGSENMLINTIHVLFAREHNRLCDVYKAANPSWNDEQLFQKARTYLIAEYQNIVYNELLPSVFGLKNVRKIIGDYEGYDSNVNPETSNLWATVAFRYGHTTVPETMNFYDDCGDHVTTIGVNGKLTQGGQNGGSANNLTLTPTHLLGLARNHDNYLRLTIRTPDERFDHLMVPNVQNINLAAPVLTGIDIAAADFRRARLHGIPNYHTVRQVWFSDDPSQNSLYGLPGCSATETSASPDPLDCFLLLTDNCTLANLLRTHYGKLNRIDPLLGVLVEAHMKGSALGPTATRIILEQFKRTRDGDRFWWQNIPSSGIPSHLSLKNSEKTAIRKTSFRDIVARNSDVQFIPHDIFFTVRNENPDCEEDGHDHHHDDDDD